MINRIKILGIAITMIAGLAACEKTYMEPTPTAAKQAQAKDSSNEEKSMERYSRITTGSWKISKFQWHSNEINDHFKSYVFQFLPNGTAVATYDNISEKGKWSRGDAVFRLLFDTKPLKELNNNRWHFLRENENIFTLKGVSPYDNSSSFIMFERL
ncbi:MAG TPA: hypothetical protein VGC65_06685 [Bacteroidia bacterium]|jgi:hypothetical protein